MKRLPKGLLIALLILVGSVYLTSVAFSSQAAIPILPAEGEATPLPLKALFDNDVFIPLLNINHAYTIYGQVKNAQDQPVANVAVVNDVGQVSYTDGNGNYAVKVTGKGEHAVAPINEDMMFLPGMSDAVISGDSGGHDFTALEACSSLIENGGFEDGNSWWNLDGASIAAGQTHSGSQAAFTGVVSGAAANAVTDTESWIESPTINVPANAGEVRLRLWLYPMSAEPANYSIAQGLKNQPALSAAEMVAAEQANDAQYIQVLGPGGVNDQPLETLLWFRSNDRQWTFYEFNLSKYAGQQIKLQIGTYNDGTGGATGMFVDDVSLQGCEATEDVNAPTAPDACKDLFSNSGFEFNGGWQLPLTPYPANYTTVRVRNGDRAMRTGIVDSADNIYSYSSTYQEVKVPNNSVQALLRVWYYPISTGVAATATTVNLDSLMNVDPWTLSPEDASVNDFQYITIRDGNNVFLENKKIFTSNAKKWEFNSFDLTYYKGKTIRIYFGSFNNGYGGVTSMYLDDLSFDSCDTLGPTPTPGPTATPTITPTSPPPTSTPLPSATPLPGACSDALTNSGFEKTTGWYIPATEFSAGYSTIRVRNGTYAMRTGIYYPAHNTYSYSDAGQYATIKSSIDTATLKLWVYPYSGDTGFNDVQYVLILDEFGNWIDTLLWQRSDDQVWDFKHYDISEYIGETIRVHFGTYNNGFGGVTSMFVDDVTLEVCP